MDGRRTAAPFLGTPLNRSFNNDHNSFDLNLGPISSRRARLNQQQTVRDEQGRRRFHGAFTGGFSAGYHNSVATIQGFQPKSFVSRRADRRKDSDSTSLLSQRPEDFMDEEDLSEFGIAPKKIRMLGDYQTVPSLFQGSHRTETRSKRSLKPVSESIGEKILRRMSDKKNLTVIYSTSNKGPISYKNDYYGLGYKPLGVQFLTKDKPLSNPVQASLGCGRRLEISGEAFGSGVIDDDEDYFGHTNEYGYDDLTDYKFDSKSRSQPRPSNKISLDAYRPTYEWQEDQLRIEGFVMSRDLDAMKQCDDIYDRYPLPSIEPDWQMPTRSEPYFTPQTSQTVAQQELNWQKAQESTSSFNKKFTSSSTRLITTQKIEEKSGLLSYSDIKAADEAKVVAEPTASNYEPTECLAKASITRKTIEWRPCSLLCKHFNVPNPYPDNAYFGSKISALASLSDPNSDQTSLDRDKNHLPDYQANRIASIELRRDIFNINLDCHEQDDHDLSTKDEQDFNFLRDECTDSENEPQILESDEIEANVIFEKSGALTNKDERDIKKADDDSDEIVIVSMPKTEPEVIVLSSTTSSSSVCSSTSSSSSSDNRGRLSRNTIGEIDQDSEEDTYGPPLPPAQQALIVFSNNRSVSRQFKHKNRKSKSKKKNKRALSSNCDRNERVEKTL